MKKAQHRPTQKRLGSLAVALLLGMLVQGLQAAENRDTKVRNDKSTVESTGQWIYNDLDRAFLEGKRENKPLLVTLRCIP